ncbi:glycosyltransferase family 2 protein [uncultured Maribacter sp.]|uniref:glycosyltransferase family 2 protein n=1 Tax=uncultured Maribacter sp. TaxID=431308 RepID=UPI00262B0C1E|nr:glycosyltransferase family 2 protein [uncultured Maribacter sp.]
MMISVCMAVFNGEEFIRKQLVSIVSQLKENDELIISDDGSTDKTLDIIKTFNDNRIKLFYSGKRSIIMNFENALGKAKGDVIFLADQDDIWYPNKIAETLLYLKEYDLVFSNASVFKENILETTLLYSGNKNRTGLVRNFIKNNYIGATMAFKSAILKTALPFPSQIYMHDAWISSIAEITGKTFFINKPLIYYRRHGNNASETGEKSTNTLLKKLKMRYNLAKSLLQRLL